MPRSDPASSTTGSARTSRSTISCAASPKVVSGPTLKTRLVITSRTTRWLGRSIAANAASPTTWSAVRAPWSASRVSGSESARANAPTTWRYLGVSRGGATMKMTTRADRFGSFSQWIGARAAACGGVSQPLLEEGDDIGGPLHDADAGARERGHLLGRGALGAGDDRARVAHATAGGRGLARDEPDDGLGHRALHELGGLLLVRAADLADQHDRIGLGISLKRREAVDEARADDGVAPDAHAGGLPEIVPRELMDDLVGQRAAARHHADPSGLADVAWNDPDLAFPRGDQAGTVRADEARAALVEEGRDARHLEYRDPFRDADDEPKPGVRRFEDRRHGGCRRDVDDGRVRLRLAYRVADGVVHRHHALEQPPALP